MGDRAGGEERHSRRRGLSVKTLLHWWRLLVEPSGKGRLRGFGPTRWQVRYTDGGLSQGMAYDVACGYAAIFGGEVIRRVDRKGTAT